MIKAFKHNTLELAKHHKRTCDGELCNISLLTLRLMAEECGVKFTNEEKKVFI